jgi:hypothetical protein
MNPFDFEQFKANSAHSIFIDFLLIAVQGVLSSAFLYDSILGKHGYEYLFSGMVFMAMLAGLKMLYLLFFFFYALYLKQCSSALAIVLNLVLFAVVFGLVSTPGFLIYLFHDFPN